MTGVSREEIFFGEGCLFVFTDVDDPVSGTVLELSSGEKLANFSRVVPAG